MFVLLSKSYVLLRARISHGAVCKINKSGDERKLTYPMATASMMSVSALRCILLPLLLLFEISPIAVLPLLLQLVCHPGLSNQPLGRSLAILAATLS